MDLELSDEQRMIVSTVRDFVRREIVPREADLDPDADELPRAEFEELVAKVKGMGLYCADVPEDLGGPGVDTLTFTLMSIELSQHRAGLYAPCYGVFGGSGLAQLLEASDDQRERYLFPVLAGEKRSFFALTEPSGGSDPAGAIQTTARRDGDDWILNGTKRSSVAPTGRTSASRSPAPTETKVAMASPASSSTPMRPGSTSAA